MAIPRATGVWDQVIEHSGDMGPLFVETLSRLNPARIAINYARNNSKGVPTWEPAEAARNVLTNAGYPAFKYGVGHQLGRATHGSGPGLGLRREGSPEILIEPGNVFTAEGLETLIEGRGWISLEDDVLVTPNGNEVLTAQQRELRLVA